MKMLKYASLFAVVCILMACIAGTAFAAGSKSDPVEITPTDGLTITEKQEGDPVLTMEIAARLAGEKVENGTVYVVTGHKTCWRYDATGNKRDLYDKNGKIRARQKEYKSTEHHVAICDLVDYKEAPKYKLCDDCLAKSCDQIGASTKPLDPTIQLYDY